MTKRFPILISPLWRPLLIPLGVTAERAFAEIKGDELHVQFGALIDYRFPLEQVEGVALSRWPLWAGIGPRANFRGTVGLVGTYVNVVEVRFKEPQRVRMIAPAPCKRLFLSIEEPHAFIAALERRHAPEAEVKAEAKAEVTHEATAEGEPKPKAGPSIRVA
jgi:hypothetical protein